MICREFQGRLHDYIDGSLERSEHEETSSHLSTCAECRHALQRAQASAQALRRAFERETAGIAVSRELSARIIAAARAAPARAASPTLALRALFAHPLRFIGAGAITAMAVFGALQVAAWRGGGSAPAAGPHEGRLTIDVPFHTNGHAGITHAEFPLR